MNSTTMTNDKSLVLKKYWCFIIISIIFSVTAIAQGVNNGSFENTAAGVVTGNEAKGWLIEVAGSINPKPEFEIVNDVVKEGSKALKVSVHALGTNQWDIQIIADSIPVKPKVTYRYSIWAKSGNSEAQVNFTVGNYAYSEYNVIRPAKLTAEWKEFTMDFTVNDNQTYVRAPIHFNLTSSKESVIYIDNLQIVEKDFDKKPIIVEAELGQVGSGFSVIKDGDVSYITAKENFTGQASPEDTSRMVGYKVTFQDSGVYQLFARVYVGNGGFNDDSFFASNGFGSMNETDAGSWVFVNGLGEAGYTTLWDVVKDKGTAGSGVWKWVNISQNFFPNGAANQVFVVGADELTKTFQIGSREDGLRFDKFAFGKADLYYNVDMLNNGLGGSVTIPLPDSSKFYQGPPLASGSPKFLGNVWDGNDKNYANIWNQITPGNEGKWGSVASSIDTTKWNWSGLDSKYNYAKSNNMIFKDHTLVWGSQQPSWISSLAKEEQLKYIEIWMRQVGQRYPDMELIDVVNEAIATHNPPDGANNRANYKEALGGNGSTGYDWVIKAFELARKYMPSKTKLLLNDYGIINDNNSTTIYLKMVTLLHERGLIDGIGIQGHRFEFEKSTASTLKYNLDRLATTGLPIYITEFDLGNLGASGKPDDNVQLELYKKIFPVLWEHPSVAGITLWGSLEGKMWQETCHLINNDGSWRPALTWLAQYIKDTPVEIKLPDTTNTGNSVIYDVESVLEQNFPNPFRYSTTIEFKTKGKQHVSLKVYDVLGQEVATLVNENLEAGSYNVIWEAKNKNGRKLNAGTYFYRLVFGDSFSTKKMLIVE